MKKILRAVTLALMFVCLCSMAYADSSSWLSSVLGEEAAAAIPGVDLSSGAEAEMAVLWIEGEISAYDYTYDHYGTLDVIDELIDDPDNVGLYLLLNTPGGSLYEADELYHAIMTYKKETGRPVYAFMAQECCSAGVMIAMSADYIMASRMTITGNVGVYMQSYSESGLFELLGIEMEYIASGENKVPGYPTLTPQQREVYEMLVGESFDFFKQAIAQARGMSEEQMAPFLDGRLLSATQAKEMGLIDEVLYSDEAEVLVLDRMEQELGVRPVYKDVTPEVGYGLDAMDALQWLQYFMPSGSSGEAGQGLLRLLRSAAVRS